MDRSLEFKQTDNVNLFPAFPSPFFHVHRNHRKSSQLRGRAAEEEEVLADATGDADEDAEEDDEEEAVDAWAADPAADEGAFACAVAAGKAEGGR